jgi:predicted ribosome quality control (RQC) complex YloA/Tae2 family protein
VRDGQTVRIIDFYSADAPVIGVEIDENISLQDAAAQRFRQYTKAKRAKEEISQRLKRLEEEILGLEQREQQLEQIAQERNLDELENFDQVSKTAAPRRNQQKSVQQIPGVRRYLSTDGYEILVGKGAKDNDNLTFRIARPHDLWLHAGDYPGSHVVVRNPTRKEIPQRTVIEAAQLAGRFSQASDDAKVVIHYTERKFLSKPKGAVPGLVRLSSFRSITVEPKENIQRL